MSDVYKTIATPAEGIFKDKGSKFFAYAFPVYSAADWTSELEKIKKLHPKARHYCYAYRLGLKKDNFRANDDGEPRGTAGKPILGQIDSFNLTNIFVVVVRYFGGTLLGTSGLINAYKLSTADALHQAKIIEKKVEAIYELVFDYSLMSHVMNTVKGMNVNVLKQDFGEIGKIKIAIRESLLEESIWKLKAGIANVRLEEAKALTDIGGLKINFLYSK